MLAMVANGFEQFNSHLRVPLLEADGYLPGMRPKELRRENLRLLVQEFGSIRAVADLSETSEKYLSQVLNEVMGQNRVSPRGIGDSVAAKLEAGCGKEEGWMDQPHTPMAAAQESAGPALPPHLAVLMARLRDRPATDPVFETIDMVLKLASGSETSPQPRATSRISKPIRKLPGKTLGKKTG